jgi:hypothetical protein
MYAFCFDLGIFNYLKFGKKLCFRNVRKITAYFFQDLWVAVSQLSFIVRSMPPTVVCNSLRLGTLLGTSTRSYLGLCNLHRVAKTLSM